MRVQDIATFGVVVASRHPVLWANVLDVLDVWDVCYKKYKIVTVPYIC